MPSANWANFEMKLTNAQSSLGECLGTGTDDGGWSWKRFSLLFFAGQNKVRLARFSMVFSWTLLSVGQLFCCLVAILPSHPIPFHPSYECSYCPSLHTSRFSVNRETAAGCVDCYFIASAWSVTGQSRNCLLLFAVEISFHRASLNTTIHHHAPPPSPPPTAPAPAPPRIYVCLCLEN